MGSLRDCQARAGTRQYGGDTHRQHRYQPIAGPRALRGSGTASNASSKSSSGVGLATPTCAARTAIGEAADAGTAQLQTIMLGVENYHDQPDEAPVPLPHRDIVTPHRSNRPCDAVASEDTARHVRPLLSTSPTSSECMVLRPGGLSCSIHAVRPC